MNHGSFYHRGEEQEVEYKLELVGHTPKLLERQSWEGCEIHGDKSQIIMNSKLDHHLPAVSKVTFTATPAERGVRGRGGRIRGRRGRG